MSDPDGTRNRIRRRWSRMVYSEAVLRTYDRLVVTGTMPHIFKCEPEVILEQYSEHSGERHLEVGAGTGYFLEKARFRGSNPELTILDINEVPLRRTRARVEHLRPHCHQADVLQTAELPEGPYSSIALNSVLHCLPGPLEDKGSKVFGNLVPLLETDGVLFGCTILTDGVLHSRISRGLVRLYNATGIFDSLHDSRAGLESALSSWFDDYTIDVVGRMAVFHGRRGSLTK